MGNEPAKQLTNGGMPGAAAASNSTAMVLGSDAYRGALEPTSTQTAFELAELMASIGFCGVTSPAEALGRIMTGRGIGLSAMQSMRGVYTIDGRPGLDASLMHALCLASPLCEKFAFVPEESDETKATFVAQRRGDAPVKHTYTVEQARKMGVLDRNADKPEKQARDVWHTHRSAMLRARCKAELARLVFPDLTFGMYSREELEDGVVEAPRHAKDPNELAAEILSAEEAAAEAAGGRVTSIQSAPRDYAKEAEELKAKIVAAGSDKAKRAAVREEIKAWDGIEPFLADVSRVYNESLRAAKRSVPDAGAAGTAASPAPLGEGNLFGDTTEAGK